MDDLERLFRGLVQVIRETNPDRLNASFQVSELYQSILPYRSHRSRLGFDSSEDYDMAVLRLLAGQRDYVSVEPAEVMEQLALEAESINPTAGLYREFAAARVRLNTAALGALDAHTAAYAPPESMAETATDTESDRRGQQMDNEPTRLVFEAVEAETEPIAALAATDPGKTCPSCARPLPLGRIARYCPFCGMQVGSVVCRTCGEAMERGWKYCVNCGQPSHTG